MTSKRVYHGEGNDERDQNVPGKRRHGASEQAHTCTFATSNWMKEQFMKFCESRWRLVVREEVTSIFQRHLSPRFGSSLDHQTGTSGGRALQLRFVNNLPKRNFTFSKIVAEGGAPIQIELHDATHGRRLVEGEGSKMKIKLYVLNGDFGIDDWTAEGFAANILSPREGKGPLLVGDTEITIKDGIGCITQKIVFSDNSRWTRCGMFRLGVVVVQQALVGENIREGRSQPFMVKDIRGEAYMKHDRPSLNDEVWRLRMIAKNGKIHRQLSLLGIKSVRDLLRLYITNQALLKQKIGKIPRKKWDTIIEHAKACDIDDDKRYIYRGSAAEKSISLVFNCICEVVLVSVVSFNIEPNFCSLDSLNMEEKGLVERIKQQAYANLEDLRPFETQFMQYETIGQGPQYFGFPNAQQEQQETSLTLFQASAPTTHTGEATQIDQLYSNQPPGFGEMPHNFSEYDDYWLRSVADNEFASCLTPPISMDQVNAFCTDVNEAEDISHLSLPNSTVDISSKGKRKTVWRKIRPAFRWVILYLAKRKANPSHRQHSCFASWN